MQLEHVFSEIVRSCFSFLEHDFGFSLVEDDFLAKSATGVVRYKKSSREVKLCWDRRGAQFYFAVYRVQPDGTTALYADNSKELFYVFELGSRIDPQRDWSRELDIGKSTPTKTELEVAIGRNAEVLRLHGTEILSGARWFYEDS